MLLHPIFVKAYHLQYLPFLPEIFNSDQTHVDIFLDDEFVCKGRDWYTGKT